MALARDRARINNKGMTEWEVSTDGGSTWLPLGYSAESGLKDTPDTEESHDEVGDFLALHVGKVKIDVSVTLKQTSKDEIDFVIDNGGKTVELRSKLQLSSGDWQAYAYGEVILVPGLDLKFGTSERTMALVFKPLKGASTGLYYAIGESAAEPVADVDWPTVD